jgi:hypothetical protein
MAYDKQTWVNMDPASALSASRLTHIENGIDAAHIAVDTLDKTDLNLGNVDNTSDVNKPVSSATQAALDAKANTADLPAAVAANQLPDRIMYNAGWPTERPADNNRPLVWDDTANASALDSNTPGPDTALLKVGDYWWTYREVA